MKAHANMLIILNRNTLLVIQYSQSMNGMIEFLKIIFHRLNRSMTIFSFGNDKYS